MPTPTVPKTMDEFSQKAQDFVTRAKAAGKSSVAIANTLQFMYGLTEKAMSEQKEESAYTQIETDENGKKWMVNLNTGEKTAFTDYGSGDSGDFEDMFTVGGTNGTTGGNGGFTLDPDGNPVGLDTSGTPISSLDPSQFADSWSYEGDMITPNMSIQNMSTEPAGISKEELLKYTPKLSQFMPQTFKLQNMSTEKQPWTPYK